MRLLANILERIGLASMDEYCLCGIPKDDHYLAMVDKFIGKTTDEMYNEKAHLQSAMLKMLTIYGNICTNYQRDNLRYIGAKAHERLRNKDQA